MRADERIEDAIRNRLAGLRELEELIAQDKIDRLEEVCYYEHKLRKAREALGAVGSAELNITMEIREAEKQLRDLLEMETDGDSDAAH